MARAVVVCAALALLAASVAFARGPRDERVELRPADVALANRIALRPADLAGRWQRLSVPAGAGEERMTCPGFDPDFSRFTITGKSLSAFFQSSGASAMSAVEVYRSRADAVGDFRAGTNPAVVRCLRTQIELGSSGVAQVESARAVAAPRVGERRAAYRIVARVAAGGASLRLYLDVLVVQRGRSIAALFFTSPMKPLPGRARAASALAARMR